MTWLLSSKTVSPVVPSCSLSSLLQPIQASFLPKTMKEGDEEPWPLIRRVVHSSPRRGHTLSCLRLIFSEPFIHRVILRPRFFPPSVWIIRGKRVPLSFCSWLEVTNEERIHRWEIKRVGLKYAIFFRRRDMYMRLLSEECVDDDRLDLMVLSSMERIVCSFSFLLLEIIRGNCGRWRIIYCISSQWIVKWNWMFDVSFRYIER